MGNRKDALELVHQMRCGGKKFDEGGDKDAAYMYKPKNSEIPAEVIPLGSPYSLAKYRVYDDGTVYIPGLSKVDQDIKDGAYWMYGPIASKKTYLRNKDNGEYFEYDPDINPSLNLSGYDKVGYDEIKSMLPRRDYIGGDNYRLNTVKRVPGLLDMIKRKADSYGLDPNLLLHRFMKEGIVDYWVNRYNTENAVDQNDSFFKNLLNEEVDGFNGLGLDDAGSNLLSGKYTLKDGSANWWERTGTNEEGRRVVSVSTPDMNSALEIKAAEMAYRQKELAKRGLTGNAYVNAAYNMGLYHDKLNDSDYVSRNYTVPDYHVFDGGGKFFRTNLQNESPLMYQPMVDINYPIETPLRFRPQPDLGDYQAPESTGMIVNYPVSAPREMYVAVPVSGYGVTLPEDAPVVSGLDPVKDAARRIMAVENSKASASGGWDARTGRWYPHKSVEGGADTIAYGIKLSNGTPEAALALKQGYLTDEQAIHFADTLAQRYYDAAKSVYDKKYGEGEWDKLSDWSQSILTDFSYNPGLAKFPKLMDGFHSGDMDTILSEYRRYSNGKELGRNKVIREELDTLGTEHPIFRKDGGSIHIKPSHRGRLTELKARTGKSEAELYNDGNPAHKKMVVFARNARKWKHGDGGLLDNYYDDGGPYGIIPLGGDYLTYLQTMPEVSGGVIEPSIVTAALPSKFNGSQAAATRYAEGYQKGAKPVSEAMNRAGQDIFNTVDTVVRLTPTPAGALTWLGHMGADAAEGEWGKVGRDAALALALGAGARGVGWLKNYVDDATNFGEDIFRAFTDRAPGRVSTNFTYAAPATKTAVEAVPAVTNAVSAPYEIVDLGGGYMLKSLMRGNPLEKQISKNGTVNVNNIKALVGKGSKVEQAVVDKVLASEGFAGKKSIDYNGFRKAVQDELITYNRTPDTRWADYGINRLGIRESEDLSHLRNIERFAQSDRFEVVSTDTIGQARLWRDKTTGDILNWDGVTQRYLSEHDVINTGPGLNTFTFSSSRIPNGSSKHYDPNTLGHSRTYISASEPNVLHVMESQSDWAQEKPWRRRATLESYSGQNGTDWINEYSPEQADYLVNNYTSRQIQENLRYAAEKGQTKMRYPTRETAAKIEGYSKSRSQTLQDNPELQKKYDEMRDALRAEENRIVKKYAPKDYLDESLREADFGDMGLSEEETERLLDQIQRSEQFERSNEGAKMREEIIEAREKMDPDKWLRENVEEKYIPQHETILKKYDAFPKQYQKLYKGADVRTVTDPKGNTWYEVDVPENYLKQEWAYEEGGSLILPKMMIDKHSPDKLRKAIANIKAKRMQ